MNGVQEGNRFQFQQYTHVSQMGSDRCVGVHAIHEGLFFVIGAGVVGSEL